MGFFNKITKIIKPANKEKAPETAQKEGKIALAQSSHIAEAEFRGNNDSRYLISFKLNNAFKETKSHAGEIEMLHTYSPINEYGKEGTFPYLAIQFDDEVYNAVEEFKENGTFAGAIEITTLSKKFYFKARMEYYDYMMYFYAFDFCDGFWKNNGLCIVYPKVYIGTEDETKLMSVLDEAANSYCERKKA